MISYKLAKQLKKVGFPQRRGCSGCLNGYFLEEGNEKIFSDDFTRNPTLSELIDAYGKEFFQLRQLDEGVGGKQGDWIAYRKNSEWGSWQYGKTPEEAVAKLWLKLNK